MHPTRVLGNVSEQLASCKPPKPAKQTYSMEGLLSLPICPRRCSGECCEIRRKILAHGSLLNAMNEYE